MNKLFVFLLLLPSLAVCQQGDTTQIVNRRKLTAFVIGGSVGYGLTLVALKELWYDDVPRQDFRFFNDNAEWKQVDKLGHLYSAFYLSAGTAHVLRECNVPTHKANAIGSLVGFGLMVPIEILDGFSSGYGASAGDLLANAGGAALFYGQSALWKEIRIYPKFSFHRTSYAQIRPNILGDGPVSEMFKDYNGQTYWLSMDVDKFFRFPRWLNIAVGYGAEGMVYARDEQNVQAGFPPAYRQYYLSLDFDLRAIKTNSKAVKTLLAFVSMVKLPSPTLEFSTKGVKFHPFYF